MRIKKEITITNAMLVGGISFGGLFLEECLELENNLKKLNPVWQLPNWK